MLFNSFIIVLILMNIFLVYIFFIEPYALAITLLTVPLLPGAAAYDGMTIAQVSDMHMSHIGRYEQKIIDKVNAAEPHFIMVTGDMIGYNQDFAPSITFLNNLKARNGLYLVFGNSDYTNMHSFFRALKSEPLSPNIILLRNNVAQDMFNGKPLVITGLDDPISGYADFKKISSPTKLPGYRILLTHAYTSKVRKIDSMFDLILAGHTHGGQFNLFKGLYLERIFRGIDNQALIYREGLHENGNVWINVSRGIGTSYLPIRFRARPEICIIQSKAG